MGPSGYVPLISRLRNRNHALAAIRRSTGVRGMVQLMLKWTPSSSTFRLTPPCLMDCDTTKALRASAMVVSLGVVVSSAEPNDQPSLADTCQASTTTCCVVRTQNQQRQQSDNNGHCYNNKSSKAPTITHQRDNNKGRHSPLWVGVDPGTLLEPVHEGGL